MINKMTYEQFKPKGIALNTGEVLELLRMDGWREATPEELLSWKGWDRKSHVVALGTPGKLGPFPYLDLAWHESFGEDRVSYEDATEGKPWMHNFTFLRIRENKSL